MLEDIKNKILEAIPDAVVSVDGGGGHFTIEVTSAQSSAAVGNSSFGSFSLSFIIL